VNVLEVRELRKTYPAFTLKDVSLDVPQGAIVGFIGRNGAGKSTTLKSILGLVHPDGGTVRAFGLDYAANEAAIRRRIGVVLGGIDFYPKKKVGVITDVTRRFYSNWDEDKYRHYLELFAIDESKRVDQLSSGMKVKYMIALALSHSAELLILDEPTSGLDPVSRDELVELFRRIVADGSRSILFSTHITSDLEKCASHIAFIKDGEMLYDGGVEDFKARFRDKGETLEDIIVAVERRELDDSAII
jgi:ABC-2 type transport system ATP-binding protein